MPQIGVINLKIYFLIKLDYLNDFGASVFPQKSYPNSICYEFSIPDFNA